MVRPNFEMLAYVIKRVRFLESEKAKLDPNSEDYSKNVNDIDKEIYKLNHESYKFETGHTFKC